MTFENFIREDIKKLLGYPDLPIHFYWDRFITPGKPYIVYQVEQLCLNHKLCSEYKRLLSNAKKVYDYSEYNLNCFPNMEFKPFLPNLDSKHNPDIEKTIDVLFYGYLTHRRSDMIRSLESKYSIVHRDRLSLDEMKDLIPKSNYVLSLGSYSDKYNDTLRVTPALNMGANILIEECKEVWFNDFLTKYFSDRVVFI